MADPKPDSSDEKAPNVFERVKEEVEAIFHSEKQKLPLHKETHGSSDDIDENTPISNVKGPNIFERAKEEIEAIVQTIHPRKEHEGENLPSDGGRDDVKVAECKHETPNLCSDGFPDKAPTSESQDSCSPHHIGKQDVKFGHDLMNGSHEHEESNIQCLEKDGVKEANIKVVKEQAEGMHREKSAQLHHKETHGMSDDFDVNTPISEFKGPTVFERAKEEFEALVQTIHPKKESDNGIPSPKKEEGGPYGCLGPIGKGLEKVCSPGAHKRD